MAAPITALYASLLALVFMALSFHAGSTRGRLRIPVGHGENSQLLVAMRRQANFVEYVPIILILLVIAELNSANPTWLHALGASLLVFRIVHPFGLGSEVGTLKSPFRIIGAAGTMLVTLGAVILVLRQALAGIG
jgi:hypothetical protein